MDKLYTCNKRYYATRREARAALRSGSQTRYVKTGAKLNVYHCKTCDGWHLTSVTAADWQQRRRQMRRQAQAERQELYAALAGEEL
jgi:hypothetical protein